MKLLSPTLHTLDEPVAGASADADRALVNGAQEVAAVPASIPSAGDIGIAEHQFLTVGHQIVRVVKVGKVMWTVHTFQREYMSRPAAWSKEHKRKVGKWLPLPAGTDLNATAYALLDLTETRSRRLRELDAAYAAEVLALVVGPTDAPNLTSQHGRGL